MGRHNEDYLKLHYILLKAYQRVEHNVDVSPALLARTALSELDPENKTLPEIWIAANLQLRQMARSICRERFEQTEEEKIQWHPLLPDLQDRYSLATNSKSDDPQYRLLEHLTYDDGMYNVNRLRKEARTKLKSADALEEYIEDKIQ